MAKKKASTRRASSRPPRSTGKKQKTRTKSATKKKASAQRKPPQVTSRALFVDLLARWKAIAEKRSGIVSALESSPALRSLVENWAALPHSIRYRQMRKHSQAYVQVWLCHELDPITAAEQVGVEPHVYLRVFERARALGAIFPDGTLHPQAEQYLKERDQYAVVPPSR